MYQLDTHGFEFAPCTVNIAALNALCDRFATPHSGGGQRHLLDEPAVRQALQSSPLNTLVADRLSASAFAFKATLFDKHDDANWRVSWHRDLSIPVHHQVDTNGWGPWSVKSGVQYVVPPIDVMQRVLAVRLNLDASTLNNGPLRVLPGSHQTEKMLLHAAGAGVPLLGASGDAWLMRPTLVHASSKGEIALRRRVIHLEFADFNLPGELDWHRRVPIL